MKWGKEVLEHGFDRIAVGLRMIPRGEVGLIFASIGASLVLHGTPVIDTAKIAIRASRAVSGSPPHLLLPRKRLFSPRCCGRGQWWLALITAQAL
jgi:hypothetical protein